MLTLQDVKTWRGRTAVDQDGQKVGRIDEVYLDRRSGEPDWMTVKTGLFGLRTTFAPVPGATPAGDDEVRLPTTKDHIKDAPNIDAGDELSVEDEQRLYEHYGRSDYGDWDQTTDRTEGLGLADERAGRFEREGAEEAGTPTRRVRLRRYAVLEHLGGSPTNREGRAADR
jgi:hypothetical protein